MDPSEIRAIRGARSRAAFARLLGVTALTVLRWELPEGSKEARRPRAKMIDALRRVAEAGTPPTPSELPPADEDDEEPEVSEPVAGEGGATRIDELLDRLSRSAWRPIEDELLALLSSGELATNEERMHATLGLVQIQLFVKSEVRGAIAALLPILEECERGALPRRVIARAHVLAALIFAAPDARVFDAGRVNAHASKAERLLDADQTDLHVILTVAKISAARFSGPHAVARTFAASITWLEQASSPLGEALAAELRGMAALTQGDLAGARRLAELAVVRAEQLGLPGLCIAMLAQRAYRAQAGPSTPEEILAITKRARAAAKTHVPVEPFVRVLACEAEALFRLARFEEAIKVIDEGFALAETAGAPVFALVAPAARTFGLLLRRDDLDELAKRVTQSSVGAHLVRSAIVDVHVLHVRMMRHLFTGDPGPTADLVKRVRAAIDEVGGAGLDFIIHDVHILLLLAQIVTGDLSGARLALQQCEAVLRARPSMPHATLLKRVSARVDSIEGRLTEARQKLEAAQATFHLLGDVNQTVQCKMDLALIEKLAGAPEADQKLAEVTRELERLGMPRPDARAIPAGALLSSVAPEAESWTPLSLTERVAIAAERISLPGLPPELVRRELLSVIGELLPGRAVAEGEGSAGGGHVIDLPTGGSIVVDGALSAEERAALRTIAVVAGVTLGASKPRVAAAETTIDIDDQLPSFIAAAPPTRQLKREIAQLSRSNATILVTGESGSGKEVVARAVHDLSSRAKRPYVVFNCASVPRELFEGQLFGYRKGAFTGATSDNPGVIRAADGGTLFLDEIGELPLDTQPKLLRFLENAEVLPLGEQKPRKVDVRVLAATHRDLGRLVREGSFREDLYYRLNVVPIHVPPLRDRREDVVALARLFVEKLAPEGARPPELGADAVVALKAHGWPGNVRELRNVIERAMAYTPVPEVLQAGHLRIGRA